MSANEELRQLTFKVGNLTGKVDALISEVSLLRKERQKAVSLKPVISIIVVCFIGVFSWLGALTSILTGR